MDKITTLSQAIRLGATFRDQCFGHFFQYGKSCAIGAAMEAVGLDQNQYDDLGKRFPIMNQRVNAPKELLYCYCFMNLAAILWRLNDRLHWSREKIADWVEEQENLAREKI